MIAELPLEALRLVCDPASFGLASSAEIEPPDSIVGQERAVRALELGLAIRDQGFNIYVAGWPGSGRTTAVKNFLEQVARDQSAPPDWCYVHNFRDSYRPNAISLPPGWARQFQADMKNLIDQAVREIRSAFESEEYARHREETIKGFRQQKEGLLEQIDQQAGEQGFLIQPSPLGLLTIPMRDGKPLSEEAFVALDPRKRDEISRRQQELQGDLEAAIRQGKIVDKSAREALQELDRQVALYALRHPVEEMKAKYEHLAEIPAYLDEVQAGILENLDPFRADQGEEEQPPFPFPIPERRKRPVQDYEVNVLVDNSGLVGAPVVLEMNPTYNNLFGRVEQEAHFGTLVTDFTLVRCGSLHRANGGYLVLPVDELLRNPFSWESLKHALETRRIAIEQAEERLGFLTTKSLQPEPVPLDVKVILIGRPDVYRMLLSYDEHFSELFKVKADFDSQMERTGTHVHDYAAFVSKLCATEGLRHLDQSGLARIVEHGSRLVEDQERLSTQFGVISDVIREANHYAALDGADLTSGSHVQKAIDERFYRSNLFEQRMREMIVRGTIKIDVSGQQVGQVNGLSVIDIGDVSFGHPSRVTASVALGRDGLVDIERQAELGGPIHTKGVLILSGYLAEKYAQDRPLSLSARLVFEQSYGMVEGDSASSTELYALLSALSGLPIRQGIAVTGSVNQKGEVQAIGGVNEKIEGFFEVCRIKGLTGQQGVMIPESNVRNLMLSERVVEAVRQGNFHIWAVGTIDEGIEVLTGVKAGGLEDGVFEAGSLNALVDERLARLAAALVEYSRPAPHSEA